MGQLTNQYVSQSYQGLLKLEDSSNGVTATLQNVQDGLGNNLPIKISSTQVTITGSFFGNGTGLTGITATNAISSSYSNYAVTASYALNAVIPSGTVSGSQQIVDLGFATTSSLNAFTSSYYVDSGSFDSRIDGIIAGTGSYVTVPDFNVYTSSVDNTLNSLETATGSLQLQINSKLDTGSFNSYTSSNDTRVDSLINATGSYATTSSLSTLSGSIATTDLGQNNRLDSLETKTGSLQLEINQKLDTGSFNAYTSSNDTKVDALINATGSYATTGSNTFIGNQTITGSLYSSDIIGTGSLFLKPNQSDARYLEVYNTSPTDTHITASGGQIFLGDDKTYVKVDNYGSTNRIDIVADNELVVSSSIVNLTGSLHQSGTFYPDVIDWISSSIVQSTGSYILTTDLSGVTQYDTYQNVASELQPYLSTGSIPSGTVSGSAQISDLGFATTGSNVFNGTQTISGSLNVTGEITALSASITYLETIYQTSSIIFSSGSNILGDEASDTQTLNGTVNIPLGNLNVTGATTSSLGFYGDLYGTSSYATNALSASQSQNSVSSSHSINSDNSISSSFATNAVTSSFALNGGVTQILAGPNVIVSPLSGKGQVTISSIGTGTGSFNTATGSYGSFYDTTNQTNPVANTPNSASFNETAITNGVSISGSISPFNTYVKTENAGVYNIQFSAQIDKTDSGTDSVDIWIRKNGIDLLDTATTVTLTGNNDKSVAAWNWFVQSAANDYYQLIWASADTDLRLLAEVSSSVHPGVPSIILTANRVDQFLSNTGSFNGDFNGSFTGSLFGTSSYSDFAVSSSQSQNSISSSFAQNAISSSFATNSDTSVSSSFAQNAVSSSHSVNSDTAISSSFATNSDTSVSSSFAQNAVSSSHSINSDTAISSSYSTNSDTSVSSSFAQNAVSSSHSVNSDTAISSSFATNSDTSVSSSFAQNAISSSYSVNSDTSVSSSFAQNAVSSSHSINSDNSISSSFATNAISSSYSDFAVTASFATNALSASYAPSTSVNTGSLVETVGLLSPTTDTVQVTKGDGTLTQFTINNVSSSVSSSYAVTASFTPFAVAAVTASFALNANIDSGSFATTGSNVFSGSQFISGSADISGSLFMRTNGSGSALVSRNFSYLTSSLNAGGNIFFQDLATQSNISQSLIVSSSNNIVFNRPIANSNTFDSILYGSGSSPVGGSNIYSVPPEISVTNRGQNIPLTMQHNIGRGFNTRPFQLTFPTGSLTGSATINNNYIAGQLIYNGPQSSRLPTIQGNNVIGQLSYNATILQNSFSGGQAPGISNNYINAGAATFNARSGSIFINNNNINGNTSVSNNFNVASSSHYVNFSNNSITNNPGIEFVGTSNANQIRNFTSNVIAGNGVNIINRNELSVSGSLNNSLIVGGGLTLTASHPDGTFGTTNFGTTLLGRFNETGSNLSDAQQTVFAVGGGTSAINRRTSLHVSSSGLFSVRNGLNLSGSVELFNNSTTGTLNLTGSINVSGSLNVKEGGINVSGGQIQTNNEIVFNGGKFFPESMENFVKLSSQSTTTLGIDNFNFNTPASQSLWTSTVNTGSNYTEQQSQVTNGGTTGTLGLRNTGGVTTYTIDVKKTVVTGSIQGNVLPLTVSSNTASLNLDNGNFFELALTGSSNIRIEPSNIKPGQTVNIKLNTTGSGTVSFPTSVKQVSGSSYVPSTGTTTDIVTLVSFDSTNLFLANVKNLI
jgi:hypothetical protein